MKSVTMKDVALKAGVSITSVSLALRNHPSLLPSTRERLQKLAKEMGYTPNPMVSALMSQVASGKVVNQGVVIAILVDSQYDPKANPDPNAYSNRILSGIFTRLKELGCERELFVFSGQRRNQQRLQQILRTRAIQGILLPGVWDVGTTPDLDWDRLHVVTSGYSLLQPPMHRVVPDQFGAMRLALSVARERGYTRPAFYTHSRIDQRVDGLETAAYHDFVARHLSESVPSPMVLMQQGWREAAFKAFIRRTRPDVVISNYDNAEIWLREMDLKIPGEVGFFRLGHFGTRSQAHTDLNAERIGHGMVDLLTAGLHRNDIGIPKWPKRVVVAPSFVDGPTLRAKP